MQGVAAHTALPGVEPLRVWSADDCIRSISTAPDSNRVAIADAAGAITVLDVDTRSVCWSKFAHDLGASLIDWNSNASSIASAGQDGFIKLWQPLSGEVIKVLQIQGMWVEQLQWSPDSRYLAAASGKTLIVWDTQGKEVIHYAQHESTVTAIAWNRNSREIATACYKHVRLFRNGYSRPFKTLSCQGSLIALAWSPNGKAICAGSQDRMMQYWNITGNQSVHAEMKGYPEKVSLLSWNKAGDWLATSGSKDIVIWQTRGKTPAGSKPKVLTGHSQRINVMSYNDDGVRLASGGADGTVILWNTNNDDALFTQWNLNSAITSLAWLTHSGNLVAGTILGEVAVLTGSDHADE